MPRRLPLVLALVLSAVAAAVAPVTATAEVRRTAPEGVFVNLADVDATILVELRYRTAHTFTGRPIRGYEQPVCLVTRETAAALRQVQAAVRQEGYTLKVYDCFRPQRAVDDFVAWAKRRSDVRTKKEFYPRVDKADLFDRGYIARRSGHSRGSTVDLTLVRTPPRKQPTYRRSTQRDCAAGVGTRYRDNSIDMGTGYDCFDPKSHPFSSRARGEVRRNRLALRRPMLAAGFAPLNTEWWHFTLKQERYTTTFFDFPVRASSVR